MVCVPAVPEGVVGQATGVATVITRVVYQTTAVSRSPALSSPPLRALATIRPIRRDVIALPFVAHPLFDVGRKFLGLPHYFIKFCEQLRELLGGQFGHHGGL